MYLMMDVATKEGVLRQKKCFKEEFEVATQTEDNTGRNRYLRSRLGIADEVTDEVSAKETEVATNS